MKYEYELLKVNDADAILIRHFIGEEQFVILIDAGNSCDSSTIKEHIITYFDTSYIDLAICTHPDSDHKDGFFDLLLDDELSFGDFWLTDPAQYLDENDIKRYRSRENAINAVRKIWNKSTDDSLNLIDLAMEKCIGSVHNVIDGFRHSDLPLFIVGPTVSYYQEVVKQMVSDYGVYTYKESSRDEYDDSFKIDDDEIRSVIDKEEDPSPYNASSLIILYQPWDGKNILFAGDANTTSLQMMIDKYQWIRNVDTLKVPHHGSKHNLNTSIIEALSPMKSYISAAGNSKHPSGRLVYWLAKKGNVYSTHLANKYIHWQSKDMEDRGGMVSIKPLKKKINN